VRRARAADLYGISRVLAAAFAEYPWTRWTVDAGSHRRRLESLQRLSLAELALPYGEVWAATDDIGRIVSAAAWMRPDVCIPPDTLQRIASVQADLEGARHPWAVRADAVIEPHRPTTPHYYLGSVGTVPTHRRLGYGAAVLQPVLERLDGEHAAASLETCGLDNVHFYRRLGFEAVSEVPTPEGGPIVIIMTRGTS
jgi:GNAT superfamily N-acetyltransferase